MPVRQAEIIIIGGSHAGLSAALVLGRARRKVIVIDDGRPRNASVQHAHGFYTRDGESPADILRIGREQLAPYDVEFCEGRAKQMTRSPDGFIVETEQGTRLAAQILLATGVVDELPTIEGFKELWGKSIFSCPYCHGWEVRDKKLVIIGDGEKTFHYARLLRQWSRFLAICTNQGEHGFDDPQEKELAAHGIDVITKIIRAVREEGQGCLITMDDGAEMACDAIFLQPHCHLCHSLRKLPGCDAECEGAQIVAGEKGYTSIPGIYAAGDAASRLSQVVTAAASGAAAAMSINHDLVEEAHQA